MSAAQAKAHKMEQKVKAVLEKEINDQKFELEKLKATSMIQNSSMTEMKKKTAEQISDMEIQREKNEKEIGDQKQTIQEREQTIQERDDEIADLKEKKQNLEEKIVAHKTCIE